MTVCRALAAVGAAALVAVPAAAAKTSITFDPSSARAGERVALVLHHYGPAPAAGRSYLVYLVRAERMGTVMYADGGGGFRTGPPPRSVAPIRVATVAASAARVMFRVPKLAPGRYAAVLYCARCHDDALIGSVGTGIPAGTAPPVPNALLTVRR